MDFKNVDFTKFIQVASETEKNKNGKSKPKGKAGFDIKSVPYIMEMVSMFLSTKVKIIIGLIVLFAVLGICTTVYGIIELITLIVK